MGLAVRRESNGSAASGAPEGPRLLARRRRRPSGRAVLGGFLVAMAALTAFVAARGTPDGPSHSYVVVARDVIAGTKLQPGDLREVTMDLPDSLAGRAFRDARTLVGRLAVHPLSSGELIQASAVVTGDATDPRFQISLPVERARAVDGLVTTGEQVDLLVTYGAGADAETLVVVRGAEILRVDQGQHGALGGDNDMIVLLALTTPNDALAVTHAAQAGKITLVRTTAAASDNGPSSYRPPKGP